MNKNAVREEIDSMEVLQRGVEALLAQQNEGGIDRSIAFLAKMQLENGDWAKQDPSGVFFNTALLDYVLYRRYFLRVLGLYESMRPQHQ